MNRPVKCLQPPWWGLEDQIETVTRTLLSPIPSLEFVTGSLTSSWLPALQHRVAVELTEPSHPQTVGTGRREGDQGRFQGDGQRVSGTPVVLALGGPFCPDHSNLYSARTGRHRKRFRPSFHSSDYLGFSRAASI